MTCRIVVLYQARMKKLYLSAVVVGLFAANVFAQSDTPSEPEVQNLIPSGWQAANEFEKTNFNARASTYYPDESPKRLLAFSGQVLKGKLNDIDLGLFNIDMIEFRSDVKTPGLLTAPEGQGMTSRLYGIDFRYYNVGMAAFDENKTPRWISAVDGGKLTGEWNHLNLEPLNVESVSFENNKIKMLRAPHRQRLTGTFLFVHLDGLNVEELKVQENDEIMITAAHGEKLTGTFWGIDLNAQGAYGAIISSFGTAEFFDEE